MPFYSLYFRLLLLLFLFIDRNLLVHVCSSSFVFFYRMTDQDIINLRSADPFADVTGSSATDSGATGGAGGQRSSNIIHIRIQQRSGKKTLTTVQV